MPATANELARAKASTFIREWRAYVGPLRQHVASGLLQAGQPVTLPAGTTTTADITPDSTQIDVTSTLGYPTSGMIAVTDDTNGTTWFSYTGTTSTAFTGVEQVHGNALQASGAEVTQWFEITERLSRRPTVREFEDVRDGVPIFEDLEIELEGFRYDRHVMLPDATILITQRATPDGAYGTFTDWIVFAVGYAADGWEATGEVARDRKLTTWRLKAPSISTYVYGAKVSNRQYGRVDLAENASPSVSSTLGNALAEPAEIEGGIATITAGNTIDGDLNTLWISAVAPNTPAESVTGTDLVIQEVMANPFPGAPASLQWILVADYGLSGDQTRSLRHFYITTSQTVYGPDSGTAPPNFFDNFIRLPDVTLDAENNAVIVCQNLRVFEEFFGTGNVPAHDWRFLGGWDNSASFPADGLVLSTTDEVLHIREFKAHVSPHIKDMVVWGAPAQQFVANDDGSQWPGATLAAPAAGTSYRRSPFGEDTNAAADWTSEDNPMPGDAIDDDNDEWISYDLGTWTIRLAEAMTTGAPAGGDWLSLTDVAPLWDAGKLQIGTEILSYTRKNEVTNEVLIGQRGVEGTTPASHSVNDLVEDWNPALGANRLHIIDSAEIVRRQVLDAGGVPIVPQTVSFWISTDAAPRMPGETNYRVDWDGEAAVRPFENPRRSTRIMIRVPPRKARHAMFRIHRMSDAGRAKVNLAHVYRYDGLYTQAATETKPILDILLQVLDRSEITIEGDLQLASPQDPLPVREGDGQGALQDLLAPAFLTLRFERDGTVTLKRSILHPLAGRPEVYATIDADLARSPQTVRFPSKFDADQIVVEARNVATGEVFSGAYPPTAPARTKKIQVRSVVATDEEAALLARTLYFNQNAITEKVYGTTFGPAEWMTTGMRVFVEVQAHEGAVTTRNCRLTEVVHGGAGNVEEFTLQLWRMT